MEISFLGATGCVTGSCTWLRDDKRNWSFLVDCGITIGEGSSHVAPDTYWPFQPKSIRFVLLTHAHLDHCGLIPLLYKRGFTGKVWCTPETAALAKEVLIDASRNIKPSPYKESDVNDIKWEFFNKGKYFGHYQPLDSDLFAQVLRSGHILGSVSITVYWGEPQSDTQKSILFSGDVGPGGKNEEITPIIRFGMKPVGFDYAVLESTYGGSIRQNKNNISNSRVEHLENLIRRIHSSKGTLLLPSFALGRTQEVLFDIHHIFAKNPDIGQNVNLTLDAKLATKINSLTNSFIGRTEIVKNKKVRLRWLGKQVLRILGLDENDPEDIEEAIRLTRSCLTPIDDESSESKTFVASTRGNEVAKNWRPAMKIHQGPRELSQGPNIIICGSADGSNGPSVAWIPQVLQQENNILALTGYCSAPSPCGQLILWASLPEDQKRLHVGGITSDRWETPLLPKNIKAEITKIDGYSGHADQEELIKFIYNDEVTSWKSLQKIFLQHGDNQSRKYLAAAIKESTSGALNPPEIYLPQKTADLQWYQLD